MLEEAVADASELEDEMERSKQTGDFKQAYVGFMSAAANHMTWHPHNEGMQKMPPDSSGATGCWTAGTGAVVKGERGDIW